MKLSKAEFYRKFFKVKPDHIAENQSREWNLATLRAITTSDRLYQAYNSGLFNWPKTSICRFCLYRLDKDCKHSPIEPAVLFKEMKAACYPAYQYSMIKLYDQHSAKRTRRR